MKKFMEDYGLVIATGITLLLAEGSIVVFARISSGLFRIPGLF